MLILMENLENTFGRIRHLTSYFCGKARVVFRMKTSVKSFLEGIQITRPRV